MITFEMIEPEVEDRFGEMLVPADVVVMDKDMFERFRDTPNTLAHRAMKEGIYDAAA